MGAGKRSRVVAIVVVASVLAVGATAEASPAPNANVRATLIDVEVFLPAKGRPVPTTANCSNDGATVASDFALTGWASAGGTARLNAATVPSSLPNAATILQSAFTAWATCAACRRPASSVAARPAASSVARASAQRPAVA